MKTKEDILKGIGFTWNSDPGRFDLCEKLIFPAMQEYADQQIADKEKERLYWQQRCLAAEKYCEMQTGTSEQFQEAFKNWQQLKNQSTKEEI